jgi:hypothetical protein
MQGHILRQALEKILNDLLGAHGIKECARHAKSSSFRFTGENQAALRAVVRESFPVQTYQPQEPAV